VHVGTYRLVVTAEGFNRSAAGPFTLSVQRRQQIDLSLQASAVSSIVEVMASAPVLKTAASERSQLINSRTMEMLPMNGRNPICAGELFDTTQTQSAAQSPNRLLRRPFRGTRPAEHLPT